jgi:hypothetical protein
MTITYHSGGRLQATSTDFGTDGAGIPAATGGWKELGRTTLGSAGDTISVTSLADKRYYMVLGDYLASGSIDPHFRLNNDSGSNHAYRLSDNGATDGTGINQNQLVTGAGDSTTNTFSYFYLSNLANKEKLSISNGIQQNTAGAGTAPKRREVVSKWINTSDVINRIDGVNLNAGDFASGSELVVLGWDPDDTHGTNFWEELASVEISSGDNLSSGTITAKKYLWVQAYTVPSGNVRNDLTFNNITTATYAQRFSENGGSDGTSTSIVKLSMGGTESTPMFHNMFIVNNSANEKLVINHNVIQNTTSAGNAPNRTEHVGKWTNTSSQITEIDIDNGSTGSYASGTILKVWGSN